MNNDDLLEMFELNSQMFSEQQKIISLLQNQLVALSASQQIFLEILMSVDPQQKNVMAEALSGILSRPELIPNEFCRDLLNNVLQVALRPSRTTPEGRRAWLSPVSNNKPDFSE